MNKKEKEILREVIKRHDGLFSPATLINGIAHRDRKSVEGLIVKGFLEEVPREKSGIDHTIIFYRVTEKGLVFFKPLYIKIWFNIKGDIRTVIISAITALVTTAIAIFFN